MSMAKLTRFKDFITLEESKKSKLGPCVVTNRYTGTDGYKQISVKGKTRPAHIVAWEKATGRKLPKGKVLGHLCNNRKCTRASHLRVISKKQNMKQMVKDGRSRNQHSGKLKGVPHRK